VAKRRRRPGDRFAATRCTVSGAGPTRRASRRRHRVARRSRGGARNERRSGRGVSAGLHSLRVIASGYLRAKPIELRITSGEQVENVVLDAGTSLPVEVVDADGKPVSGATIVSATGGTIHSTTHTDVLGRANVATPPGVDATLFVLSREGGIVAQPVASARRITVPEGSASLQIDALADDAPLTGISLLLRYNGTLVPPEVARILGAQQQTSFVTDAQGRVVLPRIAPGAYELWAYRSDEEAEALMASQSALAAPISLEVAPGENRVTVRFKARH
jgi:hypothetical protein